MITEYAQKPQRNCTFMNSASGKATLEIILKSWILETYIKCKYLYVDVTGHACSIFCDTFQPVPVITNINNRLCYSVMPALHIVRVITKTKDHLCYLAMSLA